MRIGKATQKLEIRNQKSKAILRFTRKLGPHDAKRAAFSFLISDF